MSEDEFDGLMPKLTPLQNVGGGYHDQNIYLINGQYYSWQQLLSLHYAVGGDKDKDDPLNVQSSGWITGGGSWMFLGGGGTPETNTNVTTKSEVVVTTTEPPLPQPPITQYTLARMANQGWNTHARSMAPIQAGEYFEFTAEEGITGACLSLGPRGVDGQPLHKYSHAITVDLGGVKVYEAGVFKETMRNRHEHLTGLRIYRHQNNQVVYVATTGAETVVHTSHIPLVSAPNVPLYIYGYLFSSGDKLTSSAFKAGEVQYGSV